MSVLSCEGEPPNIGVACSIIAMYQSHMGGEKKQIDIHCLFMCEYALTFSARLSTTAAVVQNLTLD